MDLSNFGSISDVLSAIAVIGTMAYIAIQVRLARESQVAQRSLGVMGIFAQWRLTLLQNSDLASSMANANAGNSLSDAESIQIATLFDELFYSSAGSFATAVAGGSIHDDTSADTEYVIDILNRNPCGLPEWERAKTNVARLSQEFVSEVDGQISKVS